MSYLREEGTDHVLLFLYVQPRAAKNKIAGQHGNALKLSITSPPVDGQANKAVISFLAKTLRLPKTSISIVGGDKSRNKTIRITGISFSSLKKLIDQLL